jgi:hypothetical protein
MRTQTMALPNPLTPQTSPKSVFRTIALLALLGLVSLFLAGPVLAVIAAVVSVVCVVLSVLLSVFAVVFVFAVIGFFVWVPVRLIYGKDDAAWRDAAQKGKILGVSLFAFLCRFLTETWKVLSWGWRHASSAMQTGWSWTCQYARLAGTIVLESISGAVLGGMVVWVGVGGEELPHLIALGAGLGALLGVLVATLQQASSQIEAV